MARYIEQLNECTDPADADFAWIVDDSAGATDKDRKLSLSRLLKLGRTNIVPAGSTTIVNGASGQSILALRNSAAANMFVVGETGSIAVGLHHGHGPSAQVSVSTTTTIATIQGRYGLFMVYGKLSSDYFCDIVLTMSYAGTATVISSHTFGSPAARTYSENSTAFRLAMASGTYAVQALRIGGLSDPV